MCLTVEPGLYFAGDFGIRLEDLYLTTASAPKPLTRSSFGISLGGSAH
jgi:Xaa-Pro aminopeptidase